jgi:tRNA A37 N6-isopentenylltransferase MiaA
MLKTGLGFGFLKVEESLCVWDSGDKYLFFTSFELTKGDIEEEELVATIEAETRNYAKRQRTWLRSEPSLEVFSHLSAARDATQAWFESMH